VFRTVPLSINRSFSLYTQQWYMSYRFADSLWAASGRFLLARCQQTCTIYTTAVCTVLDCWWWTQELSETRRVLFQKKKIEKLVHLVGFVIRRINGPENGLLPNLNSTSFRTRKQNHSKLHLLGLLSLKIDSIRASEETEIEIRCFRHNLIEPLPSVETF